MSNVYEIVTVSVAYLYVMQCSIVGYNVNYNCENYKLQDVAWYMTSSVHPRSHALCGILERISNKTNKCGMTPLYT